jgi:2-polyprenyl-3-methyl-5-hydroxy-6-metoxy-1,4-benzoquinol methylase
MASVTFEDKYVQYYELFNQSKDYSIECNFLKNAFKKHSKSEIISILDLGCGTGMHSKILSKKGFFITGIDISESMIKKAISKNISNTQFKVGNMKEFNFKQKYDAVITMFSAIGYITKNKDLKSTFKSIKNHLKPSGLIIIDCWNGLGVINKLPSSRTKEVKTNNYKIKRTSYPTLNAEEHTSHVKFNFEVEKDNTLIDSFTEDHLVRFFFPQELRSYLEESGFEVLEICPSYKLGEKLDEKAWNMIVIARLI